jgi:hypothetical protein
VSKYIGRPGWRPLPGGAVLVWHCQCGEGCPPEYMTAEQLVAEVQGDSLQCECGDPADFATYNTVDGEDYLEVDLTKGVVYVPSLFPFGSPIEVRL